jgi:thiamine pyrophosphate-dependent acetolactate synthase large subunit-like protein
VQSAEDIPEIVKKAFHIATTGRPGPVVIDIPKDFTDPEYKFEFNYPSEVNMRSYNPPKEGDMSRIKEAVDLIENSKRPVIYSGGGVIQNDASAELTALVKLLNFPVTNTLMGLGAFPGSDPQFMGMLGMHGTYQANMAMHNADLIIAVGARFDDRITNDPKQFALGAKKIHIDVDAASVSKIIHADIPIGEAFITSDVGQHQMFAAQYYHFDKPRQWINSGGLGTMGFGLPSAMGVQLAYPESIVACVTGEGSIQMCIQELSTCLQYGLPIKIINLNNAALGMVRQWQDMQYGGRHSSSTYENSLPDFIALAESYGHVGIKVAKFEDLESAMKECISLKDRLVFLDVDVDPNEHVYPMLEAGNAMDHMWLGKEEKTWK